MWREARGGKKTRQMDDQKKKKKLSPNMSSSTSTTLVSISEIETQSDYLKCLCISVHCLPHTEILPSSYCIFYERSKLGVSTTLLFFRFVNRESWHFIFDHASVKGKKNETLCPTRCGAVHGVVHAGHCEAALARGAHPPCDRRDGGEPKLRPHIRVVPGRERADWQRVRTRSTARTPQLAMCV